MILLLQVWSCVDLCALKLRMGQTVKHRPQWTQMSCTRALKKLHFSICFSSLQIWNDTPNTVLVTILSTWKPLLWRPHLTFVTGVITIDVWPQHWDAWRWQWSRGGGGAWVVINYWSCKRGKHAVWPARRRFAARAPQGGGEQIFRWRSRARWRGDDQWITWPVFLSWSQPQQCPGIHIVVC